MPEAKREASVRFWRDAAGTDPLVVSDDRLNILNDVLRYTLRIVGEFALNAAGHLRLGFDGPNVMPTHGAEILGLLRLAGVFGEVYYQIDDGEVLLLGMAGDPDLMDTTDEP